MNLTSPFGLRAQTAARVVARVCSVALLAWICTSAAASDGECLLNVDGVVYLDGPCNIEMRADGSFTVGVGEPRSKFFAYVNLTQTAGIADGYWNGPEAESHAHYELGTLGREGACWANSTAQVCAWRPGTRAR